MGTSPLSPGSLGHLRPLLSKDMHATLFFLHHIHDNKIQIYSKHL
jgi:hypothetical protein